MGRRNTDQVLRTGEVTVEKGGKVYTAKYELLRGSMVRLQTGQAAQLGRFTEKEMALILLREIIGSGLADREGLGRPKTS